MPKFKVTTNEIQKFKMTYEVEADNENQARAAVASGAVDEPKKEEFMEFISDTVVSCEPVPVPADLTEQERANCDRLFAAWFFVMFGEQLPLAKSAIHGAWLHAFAVFRQLAPMPAYQDLLEAQQLILGKKG